MSKEIELSQGYRAIVDDEDFEQLNQFNWHARVTSNAVYAVRNRDQTVIQMHRVIMKASKGIMVDHINRNALDNRKENLRLCTRSQNLMNSESPKKKKGKTSKYKGVYLNSSGKKWCASIRLNRKLIYLGSFEVEKDAALAYDNAALKYFGDFARINFVDGEDRA